MTYYNDMANNCTDGVGILVHHGGCTSKELIRNVTVADSNVQLQIRANLAACAVTQGVRHRRLSQSQFDALISFTYSIGVHRARRMLAAADAHNDAEVVQGMSQNVYVLPLTAAGARLPAPRAQGLVNRRRDETATIQSSVNHQAQPP